MRLHRLEITAFGPYAGTEVVDMDALTASGLFLLEGPTGAGKSTVLDAVTFALYGTTASSSTSDDRLHSDFADPRTTPSVQLELSVGGERLRVRRTPAHERPKLRGDGVTTEPSSVHLERLEGGAWTSLSSNKAEVGSMLTERLGLSVDQFTQVVLLPQGEFAAFLKADDDTRRALLTTIFGTRLYDRVTRDLEAARAAAAREREAAQARIGQALAAAAEAAGLDGEEARRLVDLPAADRPAELDAVDVRLRAGLEVAERGLRDTESALATATAAHEQAELRRGLHAALAAAHEALEEHLAGRADHDRAGGELRRALAAAPVGVLLDQLDETEGAVRAALSDLAAAGVADVDAAEVPHHLARARDEEAEAATLEHLVEAERGLAGLRADADRARTESTDAAHELADLRDAADALPASLDAAERALTASTATASGVTAAEADERALADRLAAAGELAALLPRLAAAEAAARSADDERRARVDEHQALLQRHLDGIAARLALELADGAPCPVCGSVEHPAPAQAGDESVSAAEVEGAEAQRRDAEEHARSLEADAGRLAVERAGLVARAGTDHVDVLRGALEDVRARAGAARAAADALPALQDEVAALRQEQTRLGDATARAAAVAAQSEERARAAEAALTSAERQLADARGGHTSVAERQAALRSSAERHRTAAEALDRLGDARARHDALLERAGAAAMQAGFEDVDAARRARRTPEEVVALEDAVAGWAAREAALRGAVDDTRFTGLDPAEAAGAEDLARETALARSAAAAARDAAVEAASDARRRVEAFGERRRAVARAEAEHARVQAGTAAVVRLAGLAKGTSDSRMSLTTYVLRRWFEQVVQAANLRLATMSSGRYELERVDDVEKGERRAGLSLRVVDRHTGESRSPKSLSGGETFYTSLALALGLADVVRAEAGGVELDTLFIDEGFGTLDPDTLEQVMSVVDELRNGGRVVGIVSHVADLKEQVAERLEVRRLPDGSSTTRVVA